MDKLIVSQYLKRHKEKHWIHWNMRDSNYGFKAIEHRSCVLGISSIMKIPDENKIDLSQLLIQLYGKKYINHPRMESLMVLNDTSLEKAFRKIFRANDVDLRNVDTLS